MSQDNSYGHGGTGQRVSKFENVFFFFFDEWIEDRNTAINGPSSAHQGNAI